MFLGIGTGHTAMRVMGQDPIGVKDFREYLRVTRELLDGKAVDYTYGGKTREIKFLHRDRHFINLDNHIPIYVAANGPKACEAAGAYGDGWTTIGRTTEDLESRLCAYPDRRAGGRPQAGVRLSTSCFSQRPRCSSRASGLPANASSMKPARG